MACNGSAIDFPRVGALEPNVAFGGQSLEIQREVWILYPRIVPICNIYIYIKLHDIARVPQSLVIEPYIFRCVGIRSG